MLCIKINQKCFGHKIIYPKSSLCRKNSLLKESFAKGIAYFFKVFLECCIYWVGFAFRNPPGTQPIARSEVYLSCGSNQLAAMQLSAQLEKLQLP